VSLHNVIIPHTLLSVLSIGKGIYRESEASLFTGTGSITLHVPDTHAGLHSFSFHFLISVGQMFTYRYSGALGSKT